MRSLACFTRICRWVLVLPLLLALPGAGTAQGPSRVPAPPADTVAAGPPGAPVLLGSDTLFTLYGHLGPFGPAERAQAVSARLTAWRARLGRGVDSLRVVEVEQRHELTVGDQVLMTVLDADAAPTGTSRAATAEAFARRIRQATANAEAATTLRAVLLDALYALITTAALVLLLLLLRAAARRAYAILEGPRIPALRIQRFELLSAARLSTMVTGIARGARVVVTLLLLYFYVPMVLSFFPWTAPLSRRIVSYVEEPLRSVWGGFLAYLPKVFFIAVIVLVTRYLLKLIHLVFRAIASGAVTLRGFHRDWAEPTYNIVRFLVIAFAAVVMFPYLPGSGSDAFKGISLFVGVLFSLGSSGAVGNIVAGVVLTYTQAFRVGDRVKIGDTLGDVSDKTLLVTRVRTIKNVEVTIPNGTVLSSQVLNYSTLAATRGLILHTTVTIGYDAPWATVHELLIAAARATDNLQSEPAPFVLQTSLDDFYVSYQINAYSDQPELMAATYSALHRNIQDQFKAAGVEIMSPHYAALRDGNARALPPDGLPPDYRAPAFRVETRPGRETGP